MSLLQRLHAQIRDVPAPQTGASVRRATRARPVVLFVDDDIALAQLAGELLEAKGYELDFAHDGAQALSLLGNNPYDAVVLDVRLPRMDGLRVCRAIREQLRRREPVLMLSGLDRLEDKIAGLEAGADDYLVKPFSILELRARLEVLLRRKPRQAGRTHLAIADLELDLETGQARRGGRLLNLTPIGLQVLALLMLASPGVISRDEIERTIWGDRLPETDTLRSHLYTLRVAVDRPFDTPLIQTVIKAGFKISAPSR